MARVETVTGAIENKDMGRCLIHEHLVATDWNVRMNIPGWLDEDKVADVVAAQLKMVKERYGIQTVGDPTPWSLGRDVRLLQKIAEKAEVNVLCATGFYADDQPYFRGVNEKTLVDYMVNEINHGIQGTSIKPAIIKCATNEKGVTPQNRVLLTASAKAHKETGLPIFTHTYPANGCCLVQQDIFESEGVDLRNVVIGHCGDSNDIEYLEKVLERGSYIGLDRFGQDKHNPLEDRIKTTAELIKRGWGKQLIMSHDCIVYYNNDRFDMKPEEDLEAKTIDLRYIDRFVIPALKEQGISEEAIEEIMTENPQRIFA